MADVSTPSAVEPWEETVLATPSNGPSSPLLLSLSRLSNPCDTFLGPLSWCAEPQKCDRERCCSDCHLYLSPV